LDRVAVLSTSPPPKGQKQLFSLLVFSIIFGVGPKIFGISALDEIALFLYICFFIKEFEYKINLVNILILYFIYVSLKGFIILESWNSIRYLLISVSIIFLINININKKNNHKDIIIKSSFLYLFVYSIIIFIQYIFDLKTAYWQDSIWSGTAYASFGCYFSIVSILILSKGRYFEYLSVYMYSVIAFLSDSRLMEILLVPIFLIILLKLFSKINKYKFPDKNISIFFIISLITYLFMSFFSFYLIWSKAGPNHPPLNSAAVSTIKDYVSSENNGRDADRKESNNVVFDLASKDLPRFIFGGGALTHQNEMRNYLTGSSRVVRPTGLPAIIFDGGILLLFIIVYLAVSSIIEILKIKNTKLFIVFGAITLPILAMIILPITNPLDMILFWLCIIPGSFPSMIATLANGECK